MSQQSFYKMTGSGNDFVCLDGREHRLADWPGERIRAVCDRRRGVGADGIVHLSREADGAIRMIYYNADGSHAEMCGNAALCTTRLAVQLDLADPHQLDLATDAGRLESRCIGPGWEAELRFPRANVPRPLDLALVETGNVDIMIAIRSNFFYTRAVPCELWFLNRDKPKVQSKQVLMIDARNVYRKVTRKIFDFSPEHEQNLLAIVWL